MKQVKDTFNQLKQV